MFILISIYYLTHLPIIPIEVDVVGFNKKDNAEAVTTVKNGIEVCNITFKTKGEVFNRWINNKRLRKKVSSIGLVNSIRLLR